MQRWIQPGLVIALGLTAVSALPLALNNEGRTTAVLQRKAARFAAQEDYAVRRALCLNDGQVVQDECKDEAQEALDEEYELINEQFDARLDVLGLIGYGRYDPQIVPAQFSANITNTYFPLVVGRTLVYELVNAEGIEHVEVETQNVVRTIDGVDCRQVRDVATFNGVVGEDTLDWYAQNQDGNVWYMGEVSQNFEDGLLDNLDGSWRSGKEGAKSGIQMPASPVVGQAYRQEYALGEAEDMARIFALDQTATVPAGVFQHCLVIDEWTPISPGLDHFERKYFAPGVGLVLAVHLGSGEREELVEIRN